MSESGSYKHFGRTWVRSEEQDLNEGKVKHFRCKGAEDGWKKKTRMPPTKLTT